MARIALFVGAAGYIILAALLGIIFSLEVDIFVGNARFGPMNILAATVLMALVGSFLLVASWNIPRNS